ncbi:5'-deoxynucleotidase HDDC2-like isoform X2 [Haliotis rufescens]|uniref:5'-deoxynucleotidase HDDC2-like isoform X2 n=1 Tax=Haliotis rufescens TaxID=6454 RepID=UPI001EAFD266|nr:5'-deoxynucleotidase HDDC2-like isoform X2 [Haliotis rufescens]
MEVEPDIFPIEDSLAPLLITSSIVIVVFLSLPELKRDFVNVNTDVLRRAWRLTYNMEEAMFDMHVRRTGWVQKKVGVGGGPESVADHMYRMAVLSFLVDPGAGLDKHRCMKIALVHDMAECIVGDITPQDGISKEDKHKKEKTAMKHICSLVEESVGQEIYSLWQEYEDQSSKEAEFIKDIDRFEMILQAFEYEQMDMKPRYLQDFFDSTKGKFKTEQVKAWVQSLEATRNTTPNM